jgi:hypothetical protein
MNSLFESGLTSAEKEDEYGYGDNPSRKGLAALMATDSGSFLRFVAFYPAIVGFDALAGYTFARVTNNYRELTPSSRHAREKADKPTSQVRSPCSMKGRRLPRAQSSAP